MSPFKVVLAKSIYFSRHGDFPKHIVFVIISFSQNHIFFPGMVILFRWMIISFPSMVICYPGILFLFMHWVKTIYIFVLGARVISSHEDIVLVFPPWVG